MKYVSLLRGINVGGNTLIKMAELKKAVEKSGFENVETYINSGNVIFESNEKNIPIIIEKFEDLLLKTFNFKIRVVVRSHVQLNKVLSDVPSEWKKPNDLRCYIAFIKEPVTAKEALGEVELRDGVDFVKAGPGVLYMSTKLSGLTKSGFTKLIGKKIYQNMTMRNYNTTQKLLVLMEQK